MPFAWVDVGEGEGEGAARGSGGCGPESKKEKLFIMRISGSARGVPELWGARARRGR
jgi:hypothetical protein